MVHCQASSPRPLATFPWRTGHPFALETLPSFRHLRFSSCLPAQFSVILSRMPVFSASQCQEALGSAFTSTPTLGDHHQPHTLTPTLWRCPHSRPCSLNSTHQQPLHCLHPVILSSANLSHPDGTSEPLSPLFPSPPFSI